MCVCVGWNFLGISPSDRAMVIFKKRKLMTFITKLYIYTHNTCVCVYIYIRACINRPYVGPKLLDSVPFSMNPLICFTINITDNEGISL